MKNRTHDKAKILEASRNGSVSTLVVEFNKKISKPVVPSGLYLDPSSGEEVFELHNIIDCKDLTFTFETYNSKFELPAVNKVFFYRGWWFPEAMEAVLDTEEKWEHRIFPDNGNHEHCLFTWETIASYSDEKDGRWSSKYGWITNQCYKDFIVNDIYRVRK